MKSSIRLSLILATLTLSIPALAGEMHVRLSFRPQENVRAYVPRVAGHPSMPGLTLALVDGRDVDAATKIGNLTTDHDNWHDIIATSDPADFVFDAIERVFEEWGIPGGQDSDFRLEGKLTRFFVSERNRPVGSTYVGQVGFEWVLVDPGGERIWNGRSSGESFRYGRKLSPPNCNEVLSDALKEAITSVLDRPGFLDAAQVPVSY